MDAGQKAVENSKLVFGDNTKEEQKLLLFTTRTCPNCKMAKIFLDKAQVPYSTCVVDEDVDLAKQYGIKQAPTLVLVNGDKFELISMVGNIRKFIDENYK